MLTKRHVTQVNPPSAAVSIGPAESEIAEKIQDDLASTLSPVLRHKQPLSAHIDLTSSSNEAVPGSGGKVTYWEKAISSNRTVKNEFQMLDIETANQAINDDQIHLDLAKIHAPFLLFIRFELGDFYFYLICIFHFLCFLYIFVEKKYSVPKSILW